MVATAQTMQLGEVIRFGNGKAIKPGGEGCYPVYGSNGIIGGCDEFRYENGVIIGRVRAYCASVAYLIITDIESRTGNSGSKFQNGDTLFARITPCLENGKTGFAQFLPDASAVAFGSTEFIVMRSQTLTPEFVYCLARSDEFRGNAIKSTFGATGRQRVQEKCFDGYLNTQPPKELLERFAAIVQPSFQLIHKLHLRRTRDLLLPRLLSGQVELQPTEYAK